jgi:hypothetical protein
MASGIDMSARMISLAVNIALMGFILVEGVLASLRRLTGFDAERARSLAERIAAGTLSSTGDGVSGAAAHAALVQGFGWVMLYGGVGVWILAAASLAVFGPGPVTSKASSCEADVGACEDNALRQEL